MNRGDEDVKRMAELLRSGGTMLFKHCPQCGSPLFKIQDEVFCPRCEKRVVEVKNGNEVPETFTSTSLNDMRSMVLSKLQEICQKAVKEERIIKLKEVGDTLSIWLDVLDKIIRIREGVGESQQIT